MVKQLNPRQQKLYNIIFKSDTPEGKFFDLALLLVILLSVSTVLIESIPGLSSQYIFELHMIEWVFTALFLFEYILRIYCSPKPIKYVTSFFGIIDIISVLPVFLSLVMGGAQSLIVIRLLRLTRVFRILKITRFTSQARVIMAALRGSSYKISLFLYVVIILTTIFGSLIYFVESGKNPAFDSIPRSIYWCIVTITTVGYGDMSPITPLGQFLASILMIMGYGIIAVPTGIVTSELIGQSTSGVARHICPNCNSGIVEQKAKFCPHCGAELEADSVD
jgi:voltage-gated potassium channel